MATTVMASAAGEIFGAVLAGEDSETQTDPGLIKATSQRNEKKKKNRKTKTVDSVQAVVENENHYSVETVKQTELPESTKPQVLHEKIDVVVINDSDESSDSKEGKGSKKSRRTAVTKKKKSRCVQDQDTSVKKQTTLTDHFQVRRSERASKTREVEAAKAALQKKILSGAEEGLEIRVLEEKGRGIFSQKSFKKGDFVCEYAGELIDAQEAREREIEYEKDPEIGSYMYFFEYRNKKYCVDATPESSRLGRLLNHSKTASNVSSKLFPINGVPYLILCASEDIEPGQELLYDYGDRSKKSLDDHPWLAS